MILTLSLQADWPPQNETELLETPYYNIVEGDKTLDMGFMKMIYDVKSPTLYLCPHEHKGH